MARDDRLKQVQGAGADFLETARARAEEFLRELSRAGLGTTDRAQGTLDDLVEGGRRGTEQLLGFIRREISHQLGMLGLATKGDVADAERRVSGKVRAATKAAPASKSPASKSPASKSPASRTGGSKSTASKSAASKSASAARSASATTARKAATTARKAGATKSSGAAKSGGTKAGGGRKAAATKKTAG